MGKISRIDEVMSEKWVKWKREEKIQPEYFLFFEKIDRKMPVQQAMPLQESNSIPLAEDRQTTKTEVKVQSTSQPILGKGVGGLDGIERLQAGRLFQEEFAPEISLAAFQSLSKQFPAVKESSLSQRTNSFLLADDAAVKNEQKQTALVVQPSSETEPEVAMRAQTTSLLPRMKVEAFLQKANGGPSLTNEQALVMSNGKRILETTLGNVDGDVTHSSEGTTQPMQKVKNLFVMKHGETGDEGMIGSDPQTALEAIFKQIQAGAADAANAAQPMQEVKDPFVMKREETGDEGIIGLDPQPALEAMFKQIQAGAVDAANAAQPMQEVKDSFVMKREETGDEGRIGSDPQTALEAMFKQTQLGAVDATAENEGITLAKQAPIRISLESLLMGQVVLKSRNEKIDPTVLVSPERTAVPRKKTEESSHLSKDEAQEATALLLGVSNQVLALQQLQGNQASFAELSQMLGKLLSEYGDVRVKELPPEEQQRLMVCLEHVGGGQLPMQEQARIGQMFSQYTTDFSNPPVHTEQVDLLPQDKEITADEGFSHAVDKEGVKNKKKQDAVSPVTDSLAGIFSHTSKEARTEGHSFSKHENILFSDLNKTMQQKVEDIQKFIVKNERIFLQLNPEKFGAVEVYLKKEHNFIHVHVQTDKEESQKQLNVIFEDIKTKLKEHNVQIEITYTEREQQRQQDEKREQAPAPQYQSEQEKQEDGFIQMLEVIQNG